MTMSRGEEALIMPRSGEDASRNQGIVADAANDSAELQLLIVMSRLAAPDQVEDVLARLASVGAEGRVTPGKESRVIGAIGDRDELASLGFEGFPGVQQVLPVQRPYKFVSRAS